VATERYLGLARQLSAQRREAARAFARSVEALLSELAMSQTRVEVRFSDELPPERWSQRGVDEAEFYISPNQGEDVRPLARIASGGELSRVMLALKTLAVADERGKTLIFDEVDTGIGGRVADVVGARLRALGQHFQVLCITHLPQIAAHATTQFRIEKQVTQGRTVTRVQRLDTAGRVEELARMMGGATVTDEVRASARQMIESAAAAPARKAKAEQRTKAKGESGGRGFRV
jgi:DNA repair protein RecN (Recombination protein N)